MMNYKLNKRMEVKKEKLCSLKITKSYEYIPQPVASMTALLIKGTLEHIAATTFMNNQIVKQNKWISNGTANNMPKKRIQSVSMIYLHAIVI